MKALLLRYSRPIAACLIFMVAAQMSEAAALPLAQSQADPAQQTTPDLQTRGALPDAPQAPDPAPQPAQEQPSPGFASRSQDAQQPGSQQPVGTAAGPATNPSGVAGSRPAGAAIAPAKQHRAKAILIRVSLIVAGAAAAGAVIGLSKGSSSRP